jgi:hypothetical protein
MDIRLLIKPSPESPAYYPQFRPIQTENPQVPADYYDAPPFRQAAAQTSLSEKKQSKWKSNEDNLVIKLRGEGMKWDKIARFLPGRSSTSCQLRYQNYLEKRTTWDEEKMNNLARVYARYVYPYY